MFQSRSCGQREYFISNWKEIVDFYASERDKNKYQKR